MAVLKGQEELDQYKLTRREVADFLGITPNAVKCSIRKGNRYKLEYRFDGYQNLFKVPVREVRLSSGAEFVVVVCGSIMTMPGLPRVPAADNIKLNKKGEIEGLF